MLVFTSCENNSDKSSSGTYIGGEIVNPSSNTVVLRRGNNILATLPLNQNNRFLYKLENPEKGLYSFFHDERQLIYLEPGDSLMLRVNTLEFDESLTFTGYGAFENNFLIEMFLLNEDENENMMKEQIYLQDPLLFQQTIRKLKSERLKKWEEFKEKRKTSEFYKEMVNTIIDYDFYARKEVYPVSNSGNMKLLNNLPADFYDYRSQVDFDKEEFLSLYSYQRFLINYFNQAAYKEYFRKEPYNTQSFTHNIHKIRLIAEKVENDSVESYLLTRTIRDYLANSNDKKGGELLYEMYMERISSPYNKKQIAELYALNKNIEAGKSIPDETVINIEGKKKKIAQFLKKPTIIFFWSVKQPGHAKRAHKIASTLNNKYPEFDYLAVNVDENQREWISTLERFGFNPDKEYQFVDNYEEVQKDFVLNSIIKTFIVAENGTIINAHANLFSTDFENELLDYLNR